MKNLIFTVPLAVFVSAFITLINKRIRTGILAKNAYIKKVINSSILNEKYEFEHEPVMATKKLILPKEIYYDSRRN